MFDILRQISLDEVRDDAARHFSIVVTGPDRDARDAMSDMLTGGVRGSGSPVLDHDAADGWTQEFERASLVVYALSSGSVSAPDAALLTRIATIGLPVLVTTVGSPALVGEAHSLDDFNRLVNSDRYRVRRVKLPPEGAENQLVRAVLRELEAFDIALARRLPPFRPFVSAQLINETARANAEFALMSNLPALIPVVGGLVAAGADLFVLTKNQVMLVFKIAAAHGQDIHSSRKVMAEMVPVVGASFFWRSLAREVAAVLPAGVGFIPKTTIAYSGTYVAGRSAQYYYTTGRKPNRELMADFYKEAIMQARSFLSRTRKSVDSNSSPPPDPSQAATADERADGSRRP